MIIPILEALAIELGIPAGLDRGSGYKVQRAIVGGLAVETGKATVEDVALAYDVKPGTVQRWVKTCGPRLVEYRASADEPPASATEKATEEPNASGASPGSRPGSDESVSSTDVSRGARADLDPGAALRAANPVYATLEAVARDVDLPATVLAAAGSDRALVAVVALEQGLVTAKDVSEALGVGKGAVSNWRTRHGGSDELAELLGRLKERRSVPAKVTLPEPITPAFALLTSEERERLRAYILRLDAIGVRFVKLAAGSRAPEGRYWNDWSRVKDRSGNLKWKHNPTESAANILHSLEHQAGFFTWGICPSHPYIVVDADGPVAVAEVRERIVEPYRASILSMTRTGSDGLHVMLRGRDEWELVQKWQDHKDFLKAYRNDSKYQSDNPKDKAIYIDGQKNAVDAMTYQGQVVGAGSAVSDVRTDAAGEPLGDGRYRLEYFNPDPEPLPDDFQRFLQFELKTSTGETLTKGPAELVRTGATKVDMLVALTWDLTNRGYNLPSIMRTMIPLMLIWTEWESSDEPEIERQIRGVFERAAAKLPEGHNGVTAIESRGSPGAVFRRRLKASGLNPDDPEDPGIELALCTLSQQPLIRGYAGWTIPEVVSTLPPAFDGWHRIDFAEVPVRAHVADATNAAPQFHPGSKKRPRASFRKTPSPKISQEDWHAQSSAVCIANPVNLLQVHLDKTIGMHRHVNEANEYDESIWRVLGSWQSKDGRWVNKRRAGAVWRGCYTFRNDSDIDWTALVLRMTLNAIVMRSIRPGAKFDFMVVLIGSEGGGKTTLAFNLLQNPGNVADTSEAWAYAEQLVNEDITLDMTAQELGVDMRGCVIGIIDEISIRSGTQRAKKLRTFITRMKDRYRPFYGKHSLDFPRHYVLFGTSNDPLCLPTSGGDGRRFLPLMLSPLYPGDPNRSGEAVQIELACWLPQLWAAAWMDVRKYRGRFLRMPGEMRSEHLWRVYQHSDERGGVRDAVDRVVCRMIQFQIEGQPDERMGKYNGPFYRARGLSVALKHTDDFAAAVIEEMDLQKGERRPSKKEILSAAQSPHALSTWRFVGGRAWADGGSMETRGMCFAPGAVQDDDDEREPGEDG